MLILVNTLRDKPVNLSPFAYLTLRYNMLDFNANNNYKYLIVDTYIIAENTDFGENLLPTEIF